MISQGMTRRLRAWAVASLVALLGGGTAAIAGAADRVTTIRVGSTAPGHLKFILNQARHGWDEEFAKDGIKIEYFPFSGGGAEAAMALASGSLDVAYTASDPALRIAAARTDVKLVGLSSFTRRGASSIVVPSGSPIRTVADLKGKKIAYLAGTVRHSSLAKALHAAGLGIKDVQSLNMPFEASGPALMRGDIDALVEGDTTVNRLLEGGVVRLLLDGSKHPEWASPSAISVNGEFARRHPDLLKRFLKVDLATARWADANPEETIRLYVAATRMPEKLVRRNYPDNRFSQDPKITDEAIRVFRAEESFLKSAGLLKGSVDYQTWIDPTYLDAVYAEAGKP